MAFDPSSMLRLTPIDHWEADHSLVGAMLGIGLVPFLHAFRRVPHFSDISWVLDEIYPSLIPQLVKGPVALIITLKSQHIFGNFHILGFLTLFSLVLKPGKILKVTSWIVIVPKMFRVVSRVPDNCVCVCVCVCVWYITSSITYWRRKWQLTPVFLPEKSHG